MHLEFKNITEIDCMQYFTGLESLYLQHNRITDLTGLECLDNLQFLAIQNNLIKDLKGIGHIETLVFLDISYNKIKEYSSEELPPNLFILKMQNNPCEKHMKDYRKTAVLRCELLEEMDKVAVHIAERMYYQGLIDIDIDKQLEAIKQKRLEEELKNKIEDELFGKALESQDLDADAQPQNEEAPIDDDEDVENPNSADTDFQNLEKQHKQEEEKLIADRQKKIDARNENWESFQRLDEFEDLNRGFLKIKKEIMRNRRIVADVTKQRKKVLYAHYKNLEHKYLTETDPEEISQNQSKMDLVLKMQRLKEEIDQDDLADEGYEDEESEEEQDDNQAEETKIDTQQTPNPEQIKPDEPLEYEAPKLMDMKEDPFDEISQKVKRVLPRKILAKGIKSDFRPIDEEQSINFEESAENFQFDKENKPSVEAPHSTHIQDESQKYKDEIQQKLSQIIGGAFSMDGPPPEFDEDHLTDNESEDHHED